MSDYIAFSQAILDAIADFLQSPPIFYLVGMIMLAFAVSIIMKIIRPR